MCRGDPIPPPPPPHRLSDVCLVGLQKGTGSGWLGSAPAPGPGGYTPTGPSCPPGSPQRSIPGSWRSSPLPHTSTLTSPGSASPLGTPRRESGTSPAPFQFPQQPLSPVLRAQAVGCSTSTSPLEDPCMGGGEGACAECAVVAIPEEGALSSEARPWPTGGGPNRTSITASS